MRKKKTKHTMWALWNYNRIMGVRFSRRDIRVFADHHITGNHDDTAVRLKAGSLRITKVTVSEI